LNEVIVNGVGDIHCITSDNDAGLFNSSLCFICFISTEW